MGIHMPALVFSRACLSGPSPLETDASLVALVDIPKTLLLFGGVKLKRDIFKAFLKAVVMPLADISCSGFPSGLWLLPCSAFSQEDGVRDPHVPRSEVSLPWDAGV